jgi:hypothetical protein
VAAAEVLLVGLSVRASLRSATKAARRRCRRRLLCGRDARAVARLSHVLHVLVPCTDKQQVPGQGGVRGGGVPVSASAEG